MITLNSIGKGISKIGSEIVDLRVLAMMDLDPREANVRIKELREERSQLMQLQFRAIQRESSSRHGHRGAWA